jgi:hypothetical protein
MGNIRYATNKENGKSYQLKPDKYEQFPHLLELKTQVENTQYGSREYWKLRCSYLEKTIDETYSSFERDNCREFYRMLVNKKQ